MAGGSKERKGKRAGAARPFTLGQDAPTTTAQAMATATPERLRRAAHVVEVRDAADNGTPPSLGVRVLDACPLDAYRRRGVLDARQHDAGTWLARCFRKAVHQPSMTTCYGERLGGGGGADPMLDGRNTLWRVLRASGLARGPDTGAADAAPGKARASVVLTPMGEVAINVCGMEEWAGGTRNLAKLRAALDALADHLRIGRQADAMVRERAEHSVADTPGRTKRTGMHPR